VAYCTTDELAAALGKRVTPELTATLQACVDAAAQEIDHFCNRPLDNPIPLNDALANRVNLVRSVEWFKANDAAFGVIGFDEAGTLQAPRDGFRRHAASLMPLKGLFGIA